MSLDLCKFADASGVSTGVTGADTLFDLPPGLIDFDTFDPWAKYLGPEFAVGS